MIRNIVIAAVLGLCPSSALEAQTTDDEFSKSVTASFNAGAWHAQAANFKDYGYSPQLSCRVFTAAAMLIQTRPRESGTLDAGWIFLNRERQGVDNFTVDWVRVDGVRYEAVDLPWRLVAPTDNDIVLTFDRPLRAVRRATADEWLPISYLTLSMLHARKLQVGYSFEQNEHRMNGKKGITLSGFREVTKWCGRELLRDRLNEERVQELTK